MAQPCEAVLAVVQPCEAGAAAQYCEAGVAAESEYEARTRLYRKLVNALRVIQYSIV